MSTEKQPKSGIFSARTMKGVSHFLTNNWKLCPPNSTRNGGRSGSLYHSIQYGRLYQMLVLSEPRTWATRRVNGKREYGPPKYLHAITSGGQLYLGICISYVTAVRYVAAINHEARGRAAPEGE